MDVYIHLSLLVLYFGLRQAIWAWVILVKNVVEVHLSTGRLRKSKPRSVINHNTPGVLFLAINVQWRSEVCSMVTGLIPTSLASN